MLLAVCGGVAAYKSVDLASRLNKAGCAVHVVMTDAAREFVAPLTFTAVSGRAALTAMFPKDPGLEGEACYPHLYPSTRADVFLVAPATADMIARLAHGLGNDLASTCALSLPKPCLRVFCPAMNVEMWNQPVVQENVRLLEARGWIRLGPDEGLLACGMRGAGRMREPELIAREVLELRTREGLLAGRRVLVLSGPTREHIDPVRYIGNPSTGKMGRAIAEAAAAAGAEVTFISGPVPAENLPRGARISVEHITSADELLAAARPRYAEADVVVYAAAVADYKPAARADQKLPKQDGEIVLRLLPTPDVAATLNEQKRPGQVVIGFALQTHDGPEKARAKLARKKLDGIVLNGLDALGGEAGTYTYLDGAVEQPWGRLDKRACAARIIEAAAALL